MVKGDHLATKAPGGGWINHCCCAAPFSNVCAFLQRKTLRGAPTTKAYFILFLALCCTLLSGGLRFLWTKDWGLYQCTAVVDATFVHFLHPFSLEDNVDQKITVTFAKNKNNP